MAKSKKERLDIPTRSAGQGLNLFDLMFGDQGIAYIPDITLGEQAWVLAETFRRRFEQSDDLGVCKNPLLPEKVEKIVDQRESENRRSFRSDRLSHD